MRPAVAVARSPKKPYQAPKLLIYGNLTEMTQARSTRGKTDGATRGLRRRTGG
jgi:hypothetical protein